VKGKAMNQDLTTNAERLHGLKTRPYIIYSYLWRKRPQGVDHEAWQETLSLREARLLGASLVLLALASVGTAWLFSLMGWIR